MTDHEMILLRAVWEVVPTPRGLPHNVGDPGAERWRVELRDETKHFHTLADALTALLRDLGADVPEWPSEERVREIRGERLSRDEYERLTDLPLPEYLALRGGS